MRKVKLVMWSLVVGGMAVGEEGGLPSAEAVLKSARYVATLQHQNLEGALSKGDQKVPVGLFLMGEKIQFTYLSSKTKAWQPFEMRLKENHFDLLEMKDGKVQQFPDAKLGKAIEGTDVSYEDLAMHFLYWPNGEVVGSEKVKSRDCWKVRLQNPGKGGSYRLVYVWVDKKQGALIRMVGFNGEVEARPLKEFLVNKVMEVGGSYTLREMRVASFDPGTGKTKGLTYIRFDEPKVKPKGVR